MTVKENSAWHIENLMEANPDAQVVELCVAEKLEKEIEELMFQAGLYNRLIELGLLCKTCNGIGQVGSPPDDYFDCPDCATRDKKFAADAVRNAIKECSHNAMIDGIAESVCLVDDLNKYADKMDGGE